MRLHGTTTVALLALSGCGPAVGPGDAMPGGTTTTATTSSPLPSGDTSTSTVTSRGSSDTSSTTSTTGSPGESSGPDFDSDCAFLCDDTYGVECTLWAQDCPTGEKCAPWADDGGNSWNSHRCVSLHPEPAGVGEPCAVEGLPSSGLDNCDTGSMCWGVDASGVGTCTPFCNGTKNAPGCTDPDRVCMIGATAVLPLCLERCDPLDPLACPSGEACRRGHVEFSCRLDTYDGDGSPFEACNWDSDCPRAHGCTSSSILDVCDPDTDACCTPFCNLEAPDCPAPTTCQPYFDYGAPPDLAHLGLCL